IGVAFAAGPAVAPLVALALGAERGVAFGDVGFGEAGAVAEIELHERVAAGEGAGEGFDGVARGVERAGEGARDHALHADALREAGQGARLGVAALGERRAEPALHAAGAVPLGFTVACDVDGHATSSDERSGTRRYTRKQGGRSARVRGGGRARSVRGRRFRRTRSLRAC